MPTAILPHKELTVYKVVVDYATQKPRIASIQAIYKNGEAYWAKENRTSGDFGFLTRIPKFSVFTSPAVAVKHFASIERAKAIDLRKQADEMDAMAAAAEALPL